jgi:TonB family protein
MKTTGKIEKSDVYGIIGTIISCLLVFLLLWFVTMPTNIVEEEEGILVSFGNAIDGGGIDETPVTEPSTPAVVPTPQRRNNREELLTQEDPSVAIAEQRKKELERIARETAERERVEQQRRDELRRREQEAIDRANALANVFGNSDRQGSGNTAGETSQGNPVGQGTSGGNAWSLNGRTLIGNLATPSYNKNVEGKITVNIRVDNSGKVIGASIGSPSTISDKSIRDEAVKAAMKTRFSAGTGVAAGTITYNFKLR